MLRTAPRFIAPHFEPPSPSIASSDDPDALPALCVHDHMQAPGPDVFFGGRRPRPAHRQGSGPPIQGPGASHSGAAPSGPLMGIPPRSGPLPRSLSQPKPPVQDLSVAFAMNNDSEDDLDDGTVLDAPVVTPNSFALTEAEAQMKAHENASRRARILSGGSVEGAILDAPPVLDVPAAYPPLCYRDEAPAPSPATMAIAAAAAEMRSHEHKMTRYKQQLKSGGSQKQKGDRPPSNRSSEFAPSGREIRATASSNAPDNRPNSAALSTKSNSMPSSALEEVGSLSMEEQALAISQGLLGHSVQSAPPMLTKAVTMQMLKDHDESQDEGSSDVATANPWDITASSTPRSDSSELYPPAADELADVKPTPVPLRHAVGHAAVGPVGKNTDGVILAAVPLNGSKPAPKRRNPIMRSASEDPKLTHPARAEAKYQEDLFGADQSSSGPPSLDCSPGHGPAAPMPKCLAAAARRAVQQATAQQGATVPSGKSRGAERLRSQLGRLSLASNNSLSPVLAAQKNQRLPVKMASSDSFEGLTAAAAKGTPPRSIRDLYPIQGGPSGAPANAGRPAPGTVRNARSLSPASWKRDFPALNIPYNAFDSPRSPPKPIALAPAPSHLQARRR